MNENNYETSTSQLRNDLELSKEDLLENLQERFFEDLVSNMVFYLFQAVTAQQTILEKQDKNLTQEFSELEENTAAKKFFSHWQDKIKKQSKKELLEINQKLKSQQMQFINAISNFSITSTEEYQAIYNSALLGVKEIFDESIL